MPQLSPWIPKVWLLHTFWDATGEDYAAQHLPAGSMQSSLVSDPEYTPIAHTGLPRKSSCSLVCLPRVGKGGLDCFSTKVMLWRATGTWSFSSTYQIGLNPCSPSPGGLLDWLTAFPEGISLHQYKTVCGPLANESFWDIQQTDLKGTGSAIKGCNPSWILQTPNHLMVWFQRKDRHLASEKKYPGTLFPFRLLIQSTQRYFLTVSPFAFWCYLDFTWIFQKGLLTYFIRSPST